MNQVLVKNISFNLMGMFSAIIYTFLLVPIVIKGLGDTHYGLWNLIMSCVGYMAVLDFGIQTAVSRYVARYRGLGDKNGVESVYSNALVMYASTAVLALVGCIILAFNIEAVFKIGTSDIILARNVTLLMSVLAAIELPCNVFGSILYAYQRFDLLNGIAMAVLGLQAIFVWIAMNNGVGLWGYALILFCLGVAKYIVQYISAYRIAGRLTFRWSLVSRSTIKMMLAFSIITFLLIIVNYINFKTDNIVIGIFLTPQSITVYSIGFMITDNVASIVGKICNTFTPMFSDYEAKGERESFMSLLLNTSRLSTLVGIPAGLTAIVLGRDFIHLWLGKGYETAYTVMVILMIARMVGFPTASMSSMLFGIGKHYINLYTGIAESLGNIVLSLVLVKYFGIIGVAIGTLVPMIIARLVYPVVVCRDIGLGLRQWVVEAVIRPGFMCIAFVLLIELTSLSSTTTWGNFITRVIIIGLIYMVLFWFIGLKSNERAMVMQRMSTLSA